MSPGNRPKGILVRPRRINISPAMIATAPNTTSNLPNSAIDPSLSLNQAKTMLEFRPMKRPRIFSALLAFALLLTAITAGGQAADTSIIEITAEPYHHLLFENQYV